MTPSHVRYRAAPRPDLRGELSQKPAGPSRSEARAEHREALANTPERVGVHGLPPAGLERRARAPRLGEEALLGPFEGEALLVEERLDALDEVEVPPAVEALARLVLLRTE